MGIRAQHIEKTTGKREYPGQGCGGKNKRGDKKGGGLAGADALFTRKRKNYRHLQ